MNILNPTTLPVKSQEHSDFKQRLFSHGHTKNCTVTQVAITETASWEQIMYAKVGIEKQTNSKKTRQKAYNNCKCFKVTNTQIHVKDVHV